MNDVLVMDLLYSAVHTLGSDIAPLEQRLRKIYRYDLIRIGAAYGLPNGMAEDFHALMNDLRQLLDAADIDIKRASRLAKRIVAFYHLLVEINAAPAPKS